MSLFDSSLNTLEQFKVVLNQLTNECFTTTCDVLSNATIGQHTRHVIELYLCLLDGYGRGEVSYDQRKRDKKIENDLNHAIERLAYVQQQLPKQDRHLEMVYELNGNKNRLSSNYLREVMYNLEHAIHHHALIKIGIRHLTTIELPESFGVAPSTMQYRKACAQ